MARAEIEAWMAEHKATLESVFVPFSESRNKDRKSQFDKINGEPAPEYSLNWKVSVLKDGKKILEIDYSAGFAHCHAYNLFPPAESHRSLRDALIEQECETGEWHVRSPGGDLEHFRNFPGFVGVLYSLSNDSSAFGYAKFEDWASDFGYDTGSRAAEKIFHDCRDIASKMYGAFGEDAMKALAEAYQNP